MQKYIQDFNEKFKNEFGFSSQQSSNQPQNISNNQNNNMSQPSAPLNIPSQKPKTENNFAPNEAAKNAPQQVNGRLNAPANAAQNMPQHIDGGLNAPVEDAMGRLAVPTSVPKTGENEPSTLKQWEPDQERPRGNRHQASIKDDFEQAMDALHQNKMWQPWHKKALKRMIIVFIIFSVLYTLLVLLAYKNPAEIVFGYSVFSVNDTSMQSSYPKGSLVVTNKTNNLEVNDDIVFLSDENKVDLKRVSGISSERKVNGESLFSVVSINGKADNKMVPMSNVIGKKQFSIPEMGTVLTLLKGNTLLFSLLFVGVFVILTLIALILAKNKKKF